jgi:DNA polymerase-3 subunit epsilon
MKKKTPLADIKVLILDCQATAANPANGYLMEMGWARIRASDTGESTESRIESHLCQLPEDVGIPRRVTRITGLKREDFTSALPLKKIWKKLVNVTRKITSANQVKICPTVIHYARFEEPYLRHLHQQYAQGNPFPFTIICTHQVIRRLLPNLPRKGLRATAGFLGYSVPELRRSAFHTAATAFIWGQAVQLLEEQEVHTLEELLDWLDTPLPASKNSSRDFPMAPGLRLNLPQQPGVYRMLRSNGDLLYIGKATSLKQRVSSYFHRGKQNTHTERTLEMLTQASGLDFTVTGSALEAALLESDEIKEHSPAYNVALRQRDREIAFFSRDFLQSASQAEDFYPIGPMPSKESLAPFAIIIDLLGSGVKDWNRSNENTPSLALGTQPAYAPELECFRTGFRLFQERHEEILKKLNYYYTFIRHPVRGLMTLGKKFHLKRLEELAQEESREEAVEIEEPETPGEWIWTPEAVANTFESIIRRGAYLIRRARWFCLLSESSLAWERGDTSGGQRRLLVFRSGDIVHRKDLVQGQKIPPPPGCLRPFRIRQRNFDLKTYDRMRILTTELRRLVSYEPNRNIELQLSPTAVLRYQQLHNLLQWV